MKRCNALALSLLIVSACFAPGIAASKTRHTPAKAARHTTPPKVKVEAAALPPLPERNPSRSSAAPEIAAAAPQTGGTVPQAGQGDATTTGSVGLANSQAPALPDRNPNAPDAEVALAATPTVTPTSDQAAHVSIVPLPARNPNGPGAKLAAAEEIALFPQTAVLPPPVPATPPLPTPAPREVKGTSDDTPLPDPNPNRKATLPVVLKGMLTPAIQPPSPGLDYAAILKPLMSYELSDGDESALRDVMHGGGSAAASGIHDEAARAFALWYRYRSGGGSAEEIEQFRLAHPDWPGQDDLREKAETALFLNDANPETVKAFFASSSPQTGAGKAALASVYLKDGNEQGARELVISAWRDHVLNQAVEAKILAKFGYMLTADVHRARIDRLLYPDDKSATAAALRVAKLLPPEEQKKVAARIAVVQRGGNAGKLLDALPASAVQADVGLRFNRIQWLRRKDRDQEAWKMLLDTPSEPNVLLDLNNWWIERRVNCREALNAGQARIAYEIAEKHGLVSGDAYIEAEFLAGWIALRFLADPNTALRHFVALRSAATSSKSIALGEYWLGRTSLALGDRAAAIAHFHAAAQYPQYFYGQLGRQALDPRPARLEVTSTPLPTDADIKRFLSRDAVRAIGVAHDVGLDGVTGQFFLALSRKLDNPQEIVLLAELAKQLGEPQLALRLAKIAFNRDLPVGDYALPVGVIPEFRSLLTERVDPALVHALSRQESEFNAAAKSPVGASGLMQLMPATARMVAKQYNVKFSADQLTNAAYNTQLGEAHLKQLIDSYGGSYFLALAAYNAGGGRVADWMKQFGDPRNPNVDPIDWIERIPFTETRQYVVKIMETLQLYRSRLAGPKDALQLIQDLNRGKRIPRDTSASADAGVVQAKSD
ncbi:lytic transglycosylase domain-containing protein [Methyloceanibacter sp.]|uniref:lytic transglycosylase domain-containing protein n=1 Tax=Methyloceanibacter sp. TaxID=1965321 RepID=UPI002D6135D1|nr:transglycosylase SLT domain-containing protein [Methyloceanibacter sp.]HZP08450.1 transglycosylase SLT domain-containing protein [Methyloceanibacter sp.]